MQYSLFHRSSDLEFEFIREIESHLRKILTFLACSLKRIFAKLVFFKYRYAFTKQNELQWKPYSGCVEGVKCRSNFFYMSSIVFNAFALVAVDFVVWVLGCGCYIFASCAVTLNAGASGTVAVGTVAFLKMQ